MTPTPTLIFSFYHKCHKNPISSHFMNYCGFLNFVILYKYQHLWDFVSQNSLMIRLIDVIMSLWKTVICALYIALCSILKVFVYLLMRDV